MRAQEIESLARYLEVEDEFGWRVSYHEAGHAVVALRHQHDSIKEVIVRPKHDEDWLRSKGDLGVSRLLRQIPGPESLIGTWAGPAAEARYLGRRLAWNASDGGAITRMVRAWSGYYFEGDIEWAREVALYWVSEHQATWSAIEAVAKALFARGHLTGRQVQRIIRPALGPYPSVHDKSVHLPPHPALPLPVQALKAVDTSRWRPGRVRGRAGK